LSLASSTSPPPPDEKTPVASSSKTTSRRPNVETKEPKPTVKAKGKAKVKVKKEAAAAVEGEVVDMYDGDKEAVATKASDPPEDNDSGEEELEDVEERKAASKRCVCSCSFSPPAFPTDANC
jgi:hypothetical protein